MTAEHAALVAEAAEHINAAADTVGGSVGELIRTGTCSDPRLALVVKLTEALKTTLPTQGAKYRVVRAGDDNPQVGELVRSKWSSSGAVWRITAIGTGDEFSYRSGTRKRTRLHVVSTTSGRRNENQASQFVIVEAVE